ncbi:MAG TPA: Flp pilus assembly protein CpaB [Roseiarcus sp.]|nr:Flp pilus assembly protein CpaB [Roseiarcus sp.]
MNRRLIVVGAVAAMAFGAAYAFLTSAQNSHPQLAAEPAPKLDVEQVLVANQNIALGTTLEESAVGWQPWPKASLSEFMIVSSGDPNAIKDVKGSIARTAFMRGEPIRRDKLVKSGSGGFMSAILPSGMRAVAIKVDNAGDSYAGGFILPNDRVDVVRIARDDEASKTRGVEVLSAETILTNVRVLAIGQNVEEQNGKKVVTGANATLELDPEQVNIIILAQHVGNSNLHLVLRSLADSAGPPETVVDGGPKGGGLTVVRFGAVQQALR